MSVSPQGTTLYLVRGVSAVAVAGGQGTWANLPNAVDGAPGSTPGTFATWTGTANGQTSSVDIGFDGVAGEIVSVAALVRHYGSNSNFTLTLTARRNNVNLYNPVAITPVPTAATVSRVTLPVFDTSAPFEFRIQVTKTSGGTTIWYLDHVDFEKVVVPPPPPQQPKVWDGQVWAPGTVKVWTGSQWRVANVWDGEDWIPLEPVT